MKRKISQVIEDDMKVRKESDLKLEIDNNIPLLAQTLKTSRKTSAGIENYAPSFGLN